MGLKILHTADWHLDSPFASLPEENRRRLRQAQRELVDRVGDLCIEENCHMVLLAGDIFDGKATRETIEALQRGLSRCRVPVLVSPGNHDFCGSPWWTEPWPENVHIFRGGMEALVLEELDCRVYGAGYQSMDCPGMLEGFRAEGQQRYCIGLLHGDPLSKASPCCPVTAAQVRESGLDYLALGHIHQSGSFRAGETLCGWPGCPMGRGWDETGDKGVYLVTLEERADIGQRCLGLPRFHSCKLEGEGDWVAALEQVLPPTRSEDLFRVTLTGTEIPNIPELKRHFANLAYLELLDQTRRPTEIWEYAQEDSLRGMYFQLLQQQLAKASQEQAEVIRLAAELSQALLEDREVTLP